MANLRGLKDFFTNMVKFTCAANNKSQETASSLWDVTLFTYELLMFHDPANCECEGEVVLKYLGS